MNKYLLTFLVWAILFALLLFSATAGHYILKDWVLGVYVYVAFLVILITSLFIIACLTEEEGQ